MKLSTTLAAILLIFCQSLYAQYSQLGSKHTVTGGEGGSGRMGSCMAMSADSSTLIAGAIFATSPGGRTGSAIVFVRNGNSWTQQAVLFGTGSTGWGSQGWAVAISGDGNTSLVSAPSDNDSTGGTYVFTRSGSTWSQQAFLHSTKGGPKCAEGASVAITQDGNTALIGAPGYAQDSGCAFIYTRSGTVWSETGMLQGTGNIGPARQGFSVSISYDGNTAAIKGITDSLAYTTSWLFDKVGNNWVQNAKLKPVDAIGGVITWRSHDAMLSGDGNTYVSGMPLNNRASVYKKINNVWTFSRDVLATTYSNRYQPSAGSRVAVSYDGRTIILSGPYHGGANSSNPGYVAIFQDSIGGYLLRYSSTNMAGSYGQMHLEGVAVNAAGGMVTIGGPYTDNDNGAAWVMQYSANKWVDRAGVLLPTGTTPTPAIGNRLCMSTDGSKILIGSTSDASGKGAFWTFARSGSNWTQQGNKVKVNGYTRPVSAFTYGLGLSGDGKTAVSLAYSGWVWTPNTVGFWIYKDSADSWIENQPPMRVDSNLHYFHSPGGATISADGNTAVFVNLKEDADTGAAFVYVRNGGTFVQQAKLRGRGVKYQAREVKLSNNGDVMVLGCGTADTIANIFRRVAGSWILEKALTVRGTGPMTISGDGNTVAIADENDSSSTGAVYILKYIGSTWVQQAKIKAANTTTRDYFAKSVAISADGNTIAVGGSGRNSDTGAVWVFKRNGNQWIDVTGPMVPNDVKENRFRNSASIGVGTSVALSADGRLLAVGAPSDDFAKGAFWVYEQSGVAVRLDTMKLATCDNVSDGVLTVRGEAGTTPYRFQWSVPGSGDTNTVSGLAKGTYYVTVYDAGGDSATNVFTVGVGGGMATTTGFVPVCSSTSTGSAWVSASGGVAPYTYRWSNGTLNDTINFLSVGTYLFTVSDNSGCSISGSSTIPYTSFWATGSTTSANCNMGNGSATISGGGGTPPYAYSWNTQPPQFTSKAIGLTPGTHSVTVSDALNCTYHANLLVDSICYNVVEGTVYNDPNNNCTKQGNEAAVPNIKLMIYGNGYTGYGLTDASGNYSIQLSPGAGPYYMSTARIIAPASCATYRLCDTSLLTFAYNGDTVRNRNFALYPGSDFDLTINTGSSQSRPGTIKIYTATPKNLSFVPYTGTAQVTFTYDSLVDYQSMSPNGTHDAGTRTITWQVNSNALGNTLSVSVWIPANTALGELLKGNWAITPLSGDCRPGNNTDEVLDVVRGSYDPNYKECTPLAGLNPEVVPADTLLTYTVHFQNIGTDTAFQVVIRDTLSPYVDPATLETISSSHALSKTELMENGIVRWTFNPIVLPDSGRDQAASQGYVRYKIALRNDLTPGTTIYNSASIYFDFNEPVKTNTTANQLEIITGMARTNLPYATIYPNPSTGWLNIVPGGNFKPAYTTLYDLNGRKISEQPFAPQLNLGSFANGIYFIELRNVNSVVRMKVVKM